MNAYLLSMKRLKDKGLLSAAMILKAIALGRITEQEAQQLNDE